MNFTWLLTVLCYTASAQDYTSVELQPTVAYLKHNGREARMARLIFHGGSSHKAATVRISFNGLQDSIQLPASQQGFTTYELPLPGSPVQQETQLSVKVSSAGREYDARCLVGPAQKWKVYVLPHSHVDIGYTNVQEKVLQIHMNNIDEAIKIAQRTQNYPKEARFKWNTEAFWVVDRYLAAADETRKKAFWEAVKKQWINIDAAYGNINTSITDSRQLVQMFHSAIKRAKEQGIDINTMLQVDVPGASWGLAAQTAITGIKYFWGAPNASDRIGKLYEWQDRPFYWKAPGGQQLLYWQSQPYSIGYALKGTKIPNFFTVEDPKPFYTGRPSENFLNPFIFGYLADLQKKQFPYNMTIITWAMSDNAPIDPELPEAVKEWNDRYASPQLIITSTKQFFHDFENAYKEKIPVVSGDYTEYWTDGLGSAARETGYNRVASDRLQEADAIWALRNKPAYPAARFDSVWNNILLFNEHTWGAYNSVSNPEDPKAVSQWNYKQSFAFKGKDLSQELLMTAAGGVDTISNAIDVYNPLGQPRTELVIIRNNTGNLVKDVTGKPVPSQRLSTGELAFLAENIPAYTKKRFTVHTGKAAIKTKAIVSHNTLQNGIYRISVDERTGNITLLEKNGLQANLADSGGLNQYSYLPGDSLEKILYAGNAQLRIKENGPLVVSIEATSAAPGAASLSREIRLTAGVDRIEIINTIDKQGIARKEGVHFAFPFNVPGAQVRYSIPWGSIKAEADQLQYANRNWYTAQRWVDVSNKEYGITWSSPDAPLFEIGNYTTAGLLGGLHHSPLWIDFTEQRPAIYSWVMNNLWHTNFRHEQSGVTTFRYYMQVHKAYDPLKVNYEGLNNHRPLIAVPASGPAEESLFFTIQSDNVYVESIKPTADGKGALVWLVNAADRETAVTFTPREKNNTLAVWQSDILEQHKQLLDTHITIPAKGIQLVRIETK
ncbi:glycoside hydrolase family 38 N-terminal domain-containing protein [Chitinophaga tropicalis]|nr:glycoside hydrolase family 38 C-terminal domain-containing protein [Chitinophaga tropicalis]